MAASVINVCVVGYGFAGRGFHSYLVNLVPAMRVHSVVARRPEVQQQVLKDYPNARVYETLEAAVNDAEVDLVVLATPPSDHLAQTTLALSKGKDVVIDKPMAVTIEEVDSMLEEAKRTGRLLTVFQNRRLDGDLLTVKKLMAEGTLGSVRWVEMAYQKSPPKAWRAESIERGGGRFYDLGVHLIDQLLNIFEGRKVSKVYCRMHFDMPSMPQTDSHALCIVEFADGSTGVLDTSCQTTLAKSRFHVVGDKATFVKASMDTDVQEAAMLAGDIDRGVEEAKDFGVLRGTDKTETRVPTLPGRWRSYYADLAEVLLARKNGQAREPAVTAESAKRTMAVLQAALRSVKEGQAITVDI